MSVNKIGSETNEVQTFHLPPQMNSVISATIIDTANGDVLFCHDQLFLYAAKITKIGGNVIFQRFNLPGLQKLLPIIKNYFIAIFATAKLVVFEVWFNEQNKVMLKYAFNKMDKPCRSIFLRQVVQNMAELHLTYPENDIFIYQFTVNGKVGHMDYVLGPQNKIKGERQQLYGSKTIVCPAKKMLYYFTNFSNKFVNVINLNKLQIELCEQYKATVLVYVCLPKTQQIYVILSNLIAVNIMTPASLHRIYVEQVYSEDFGKLMQRKAKQTFKVSTYFDMFMIEDSALNIAMVFQIKQKGSCLIAVEYGNFNWFWTSTRRIVGFSGNRNSFKMIQNLKLTSKESQNNEQIADQQYQKKQFLIDQQSRIKNQENIQNQMEMTPQQQYLFKNVARSNKDIKQITRQIFHTGQTNSQKHLQIKTKELSIPVQKMEGPKELSIQKFVPSKVIQKKGINVSKSISKPKEIEPIPNAKQQISQIQSKKDKIIQPKKQQRQQQIKYQVQTEVKPLQRQQLQVEVKLQKDYQGQKKINQKVKQQSQSFLKQQQKQQVKDVKQGGKQETKQRVQAQTKQEVNQQEKNIQKDQHNEVNIEIKQQKIQLKTEQLIMAQPTSSQKLIESNKQDLSESAKQRQRDKSENNSLQIIDKQEQQSVKQQDQNQGQQVSQRVIQIIQKTILNQPQVKNQQQKPAPNRQQHVQQDNLTKNVALMMQKQTITGFQPSITSINRNKIFNLPLFNPLLPPPPTQNPFLNSLRRYQSQTQTQEYYNPFFSPSPLQTPYKQPFKEPQQSNVQKIDKKEQVYEEKTNIQVLNKVKELFQSTTNKLLASLQQIAIANTSEPYLKERVKQQIQKQVMDSLKKQISGQFTIRVESYFKQIFRQTSAAQQQSIKFYKEASAHKSGNLEVQLNNQQKILKQIKDIQNMLRFTISTLRLQGKEHYEYLVRDWTIQMRETKQIVNNLHLIKTKLEEDAIQRNKRYEQTKANLQAIKNKLIERLNYDEQRKQKKIQMKALKLKQQQQKQRKKQKKQTAKPLKQKQKKVKAKKGSQI